MPTASRNQERGDITEERDIDAAVAAAVAALEAAGVPRERCLVAATAGRVRGQDTPYATHVGLTHDRDDATSLSLLAQDLTAEVRQLNQALIDREAGDCPHCGSPLWGIVYRADRRNPLRRRMRYECMDCGKKGVWQ